MSLGTGLRDLYNGHNHFNIIGRKRLWLSISAAVMLISAISLLTRGLNLGIDFKGGSLWIVPVSAQVSEGDVQGKVGLPDATVQFVSESGQRKARVSSRESDPARVDDVKNRLASLPGASPETIEVTNVGASFGAQISRKALQALIVFLIAVTIYISIRFEWKMALAALAALLHDLLITAGIYSLSGFQVVPATVIATLTILGYSLYDTVVVFDKVQENTAMAAQAARQTYSDTVNDSLNQTMMRSVNTSLTALIPVGSLLVVGIINPAGGTLKDFALALFVGLLSGTYSSIFFASPILTLIKEAEPRYRAVRARIEKGQPEKPSRAVQARIEDEELSDDFEPEPVGVAPKPAVKKAAAAAPRKQPPRRPAGSRPTGKKKKRR